MKLRLHQRRRIPRPPAWAAAAILVWFAFVALAAVLSRAYGTPSVPCHFRSTTGVPCATCGSTRAGLALLDGRVSDAFLLNPMVVLVGAAFIVILGMRLITARQLVLIATRGERTVLWVLAVTVFLTNWAFVIAHHAG